MKKPVTRPLTLAAAFAHVDTWVFDLDNTLYPHDANLWEQVDGRITMWIAGHFGVDGLTARALQKHYYRQHGTSLRGLMLDEGIQPAGFLEFAHDIDHSGLSAAPRLDEALQRLGGRKLIFTSGSVKHAENITRKLGIRDHFDGIFDIVSADYLPKPAHATYLRFLEAHGVDPVKAAMFEDLSRNLEAPHALGMATVLVVPRETSGLDREAWELADGRDAHIHHVTDDLAGFLSSISG